MKNTIMVHYDNVPIYPIYIKDSFNDLKNILNDEIYSNRRFMILTDTNVSKHYLEEIKKITNDITKEVYSFIIKAGEESKTLDTVSNCYEELIINKFDRNDILIALGGGVVGDLTGFIASTYLRGIKFIQIPTSLLAMVDSSIGGKTGVDFKAYKNMVGAFYQPELVYINISTLNTLKPLEFNSGMSEVIKHGLIKDDKYYDFIKDNISLILNKDYNILSELIYKSCEIKRYVVEKDPKEKGERALLNFGHTIGHSIEKLMNFSLLHGECVSLGIVAASLISLNRGYINEEVYNDIIYTLKAFNQPVNISSLNLDIKEIIDVTKLDKKMDRNQIKFILINEIGKAYIDNTVSEDEMAEAITNMNNPSFNKDL